MGLINFLKDAGSNILGGAPDGAEIETYLREEFGERVSSLKAGYEDGLVRLVGVCDSIDTREQVILVAGNIKGVEGINDDHLRVIKQGETLIQHGGGPPPEALTEPVEMQSNLYTIVSGDTLSKIAQNQYGDGLKYKEIFEANRDVIKDPDKIYPGQTIRLPRLD